MQVIQTLVDSAYSTPLLESIYKTNEAMIKNMKSVGVEPKELIGWRNKLNTVISIRKAIK